MYGGIPFLPPGKAEQNTQREVAGGLGGATLRRQHGEHWAALSERLQPYAPAELLRETEAALAEVSGKTRTQKRESFVFTAENAGGKTKPRAGKRRNHTEVADPVSDPLLARPYATRCAEALVRVVHQQAAAGRLVAASRARSPRWPTHRSSGEAAFIAG